VAGVLARRIADRIERIKRDPSHPWVGLGILRDLEDIMQLLTLPEFAEWLRLHGGEHARWADEILENAAAVETSEEASALQTERDEATDKLEAMHEALDEHVPNFAWSQGLKPDAYIETIERAGNLLADIRVVLVERGALSNDDHDTELPDLIGALLS
jgi:hypothetical protein